MKREGKEAESGPDFWVHLLFPPKREQKKKKKKNNNNKIKPSKSLNGKSSMDNLIEVGRPD